MCLGNIVKLVSNASLYKMMMQNDNSQCVALTYCNIHRILFIEQYDSLKIAYLRMKLLCLLRGATFSTQMSTISLIELFQQ